MEDNTPVHTAFVSCEFLKKKRIIKMDWPAQSPDLKQINFFWLVLKRNIQDLYQPKSIPKMQEAIQQAWEDFPKLILDQLINSMP